MRFTFLQVSLYAFNLAAAALLIYDLGFPPYGASHPWVEWGYMTLSAGSFGLAALRLWRESPSRQRDYVSVALPALVFLLVAAPGMRDVYLTLLFLYLTYAFSRATRLLYSGAINAMLLFAGSFVILILAGSLLLTLPLATVEGISWLDALFTSTSAVCVTGLVVTDTGASFTLFGQAVIMGLIQLGGLGILTFTSFFAYFFQSGSSFKEGMYIRDMISSENLGDVLGLAARIVLFTFSVELIGAALIFWSAQPYSGGISLGEQIFFALFHSVSGFCNAGFSTLSNSLYEGVWRFNYPLHWVVAFLFIMGGLGYAIVFNAYMYTRVFIVQMTRSFFQKTPMVMPARLINLNARIVLITTGLLIGAGTIFFFFAEYRNTLAEHTSLFGKFTTAFFCAVTPRTAGFNTVDVAAMTMPAIMVTILLMWIGASPASTGGGIKTSTFALATLNIMAIARGKRRIELASRQVSSLAVNRAFAIVSLSLIVIGFSVFFVSAFDPHLGLLNVAFECFSAYSTVGLSLGITANLSPPSKIVIILTMFIGRIGTINILVGMLRQVSGEYYQYPKENILIN
jgi:trk system potassium uptake protein